MNESFVPLLNSSVIPHGGGVAIAKASVKRGEPPREDFTPLSNSNSQPTATQPAMAQNAQATGAHIHDQPKVTLQRNGDEVTGIQIECCCGQRIELACVY